MAYTPLNDPNLAEFREHWNGLPDEKRREELQRNLESMGCSGRESGLVHLDPDLSDVPPCAVDERRGDLKVRLSHTSFDQE